MARELVFLRTLMMYSIFVSGCSYIEVVWKALERYEKITGSKINSNKSSGLRLGACQRVALQLDRRTRLHSRSEVRALALAGEELIGGPSKGRSSCPDLGLKTVVLEEQG